MLAGTIQSPSRWDPAKNPDEGATSAGTSSLDGMVAAGWLPGRRPRPAEVPRRPARARRTAAGIPGDAGGHIYKLARPSCGPAGSPSRRSTPRA